MNHIEGISANNLCENHLPCAPVVLVVDGNSDVRSVFQIGLRSAGFEVLIARHGLEALSVVCANESLIDVVLMEFELPLLHADGVIRELRTHRPSLPIVVCTSHAHWELRGCMDLASIDGVLHKPCKLDVIVTCLWSVLANSWRG